MVFNKMTGPVALSVCPDYETENVAKAVQQVLEHLGSIRQFVSSGERVLIKPNLLKGMPPEACVTTHPAVAEAVVQQVLDCGGHPFIGDSPAFGDLASVAVVTGMSDVCRRYNIPLVSFDNPVEIPVADSWFRSISIDRAALEADKIINLPKLKTHAQVGFSGAVKNIFGCVSGKRKPIWHFRAGDRDHRFGKMLLDLYKILSPALHITDGIIAMEGNGPVKGSPKQLQLIAASADGPALDQVLCKIMGFDPYAVEILSALNKYYNVKPDLRTIDLRGTPLSFFEGRKFILPEREDILFNIPRIMVSVLRHQILKWTSRP